MKKLVISISAVALLAACSSETDADGDGKISNEEMAEAAKDLNIEAGEWETSVEVVEVNIEGLPEGAPANMAEMMKSQGSQTSKSCITEEMANDPGAQMFAGQDQQGCEVKEFDMSGGKIKSSMTCTAPQGAGEMAMDMSGDYTPQSYDMTMNMKTSGMPGGMSMDMETKVSSKRIGDCPAQASPEK